MKLDQKTVILFFTFCWLILWYIMDHAFVFVFDFARLPDYSIVGNAMHLSSLLGLLIASGSTVITYRHKRVKEFSNEVVFELNKVTWPKFTPVMNFQTEVWAATYVVMVLSLICILILWIYDMIWSWITNLIY